MSKQFIFNSSMPRSGSELLQVILHQNPEIYGSATSPLLGFCEGVRNHMEVPEIKSQPSDLMKTAMLGFCRQGMSGFYEGVTDRPIVCDKSRGWMIEYDWLTSILGGKPKMFSMVRDLREVMVSQELKFRANRHLNINNGLTIETRVNNWLTESHIGTSLQRLYDTDIQGQIGDIHFMRYEDLTTQPQAVMNGLYDYLGMPRFTHDFDNIVKEVEENHEVHGPFGNHDVKRKLEPSPSRHEEILGIPVGNNIVTSNPWFYETFYK